MNKVRQCLVSFLLLFSAFVVADSLDADIKRILAKEGDPDYGEYLAGECLTCHGGTQSSGVPPLTPLPAQYIVQALLQYKKGIRTNPVMISVAGALGDEEMAALAAYFKNQ